MIQKCTWCFWSSEVPKATVARLNTPRNGRDDWRAVHLGGQRSLLLVQIPHVLYPTLLQCQCRAHTSHHTGESSHTQCGLLRPKQGTPGEHRSWGNTIATLPQARAQSPAQTRTAEEPSRWSSLCVVKPTLALSFIVSLILTCWQFWMANQPPCFTCKQSVKSKMFPQTAFF